MPRGMAIHLGRPLPDASRDLPGRRRENPPAGETPACRPYLVLLPVGFTMPPPLPAARCALTAPFHPYPPSPKASEGGLLSVALSLGSPPPGVTRHRVSVEPGLSSPEPRLRARERPSDRLAALNLVIGGHPDKRGTPRSRAINPHFSHWPRYLRPFRRSGQAGGAGARGVPDRRCRNSA